MPGAQASGEKRVVSLYLLPFRDLSGSPIFPIASCNCLFCDRNSSFPGQLCHQPVVPDWKYSFSKNRFLV